MFEVSELASGALLPQQVRGFDKPEEGWRPLSEVVSGVVRAVRVEGSGARGSTRIAKETKN
ncbi:MAG TPA: hypothetical protein PK970_14095 [Hyphomicrobiaceae bacterium]|nr:hypothetical protein [Hyphomicrobiaceae bacterium]